MEELEEQDYHEEGGVGVVLDHDKGIDDGVHQYLLLALGEGRQAVQHNAVTLPLTSPFFSSSLAISGETSRHSMNFSEVSGWPFVVRC